jgi:hypothetical protein
MQSSALRPPADAAPSSPVGAPDDLVPTLSFRALPDIAPLVTAEALPPALPSFLAQQQLLPVTVDAPGEIEGGWPQPEHLGVLAGRCRLGDAPQGWRREDIVGAVLKVSFEDWQGGMPLVASHQLGEYRRLTSGPSGDGEHTAVVYQRDELDGLAGQAHPATLALGGQRASGAAPRLASLQTQGIVVDRTETVETSPGTLCFETWQTRKLLRREYHAGVFELCIALNAEALERLRNDREALFFAGSDDPSYPLALRRATLSVTYGQRRVPDTPGEVEADTVILGGLASMAGRWRMPDGSTS